MATMPTEPQPDARAACSPSIEAALRAIEERLVLSVDGAADQSDFGLLRGELRNLHAQMRIHHAAGFGGGAEDESADAPPELAETHQRLMNERPQMLGDLDRLIRASEFVADASIEDREVFILRVRELLAILRRYKAEEELLCFRSVWRDTGGES